MLLGALVAGLHAGLIYNTWPDMDGRLFRKTRFRFRPGGSISSRIPALAQFDHRIGAYIVVAALIAMVATRQSSPALPAQRKARCCDVTLFQVGLGIATLLCRRRNASRRRTRSRRRRCFAPPSGMPTSYVTLDIA